MTRLPLRPLTEWQVGRDNQRRPLISFRDHLEDKLRRPFGKRQISEFIEDDQIEAAIVRNDSLQLAIRLGFLHCFWRTGTRLFWLTRARVLSPASKGSSGRTVSSVRSTARCSPTDMRRKGWSLLGRGWGQIRRPQWGQIRVPNSSGASPPRQPEPCRSDRRCAP